VRMNIVLIDSENVKPEAIEKLKHEHFRVVVFVGANLKKLDIGIVKALQSLGDKGSYIQISGNGPNALDFHIAFYIGKMAAAHHDAYFHIISNDKGFDPLIRHLKEELKIFCSRTASILEIPIVKSSEKLSPKERAEDFCQKRLVAVAIDKRPTTIKKLHSAILSHFHKLISEEDVTSVVNALLSIKRIVVTGQKVTYEDRN
jgi:hypothetical protein